MRCVVKSVLVLFCVCAFNATAEDLKYSLYSKVESSSNILFGHNNPEVEDVVEKLGVKFESKRKWPTGNLKFKFDIAEHNYRENSLNNESKKEGVVSVSQDLIKKRLSLFLVDEVKQVKEDEFSLYSSVNDQEVEKVNYGVAANIYLNKTNRVNMRVGLVETDFKNDALSNSLSDKNSINYHRFIRKDISVGLGYAESFTSYINDVTASSDVDIINSYINLTQRFRHSRYDLNVGVSEIVFGTGSYDSDSFKLAYKFKNGNTSSFNFNLARQVKDNGSLVVEDEDLLLARRGVSKESRLDLLLMKKYENSQYDIKLYGLLIEELGIDSDREVIKAIVSYKYRNGRTNYTLKYNSFDQIALTNEVEVTDLRDDVVSFGIEYLLSKNVKTKVYINERQSYDAIKNSEIDDTLLGFELSYNVVN